LGYGAAGLLFNAIALALLLSAGTAAAGGPVRIVVLGDSLTAGYGLPEADSFPARLEDALRAEGLDARVVDAGVSGDTTAGGRARLAWAIAPGPAGATDAVIVELGANDALRGIDPAATAANLDAILGELRRRGIPVLLAGMRAPPNLGRDYAREFEAVFPRLASRHGALLYPFFLDGVAARPELNQEDGIHPNAAGVRVIVRNILPFVERLVRAAG
jgi:acyl-CoA thioesterase I